MKKIVIMILAILTGLSACVEKRNQNPILSNWKTQYGIPPFETIKPEHYMPAFLKGFEEHMKEVEAIINNTEEPTFENTIRALEYSGNLLRKVSSTFSPINSANTSDELQAISRELSPDRKSVV